MAQAETENRKRWSNAISATAFRQGLRKLSSPTPTASLPSALERVLIKVKPAQGLKKTQRCMAFVSGAGRALSQYYDWLQRTEERRSS